MTTLEKYPTQYVKNWYCKDCHKTIDPLSEENNPEHLFCNIIEDNRNSTEVLRDVVEPIEFYKPENTRKMSEQEKIEYASGYILNYEKVKTIIETGQILKYDKNNSVYVPFEELEIESITEKLLDSCTTHMRKEVVNKIKALTAFYSIKDFDADLNLLNLQSGILNFETLEVMPHDKKYLSFIRIPVNFTPNTECPKISKFMSEILPDETDRDYMYESIADCLSRRIRRQKGIVNTGNGSNGKTTLFTLIQAFLGKDNCSNVELSTLEYGRFVGPGLVNKLANFSSDLSKTTLKTTGRIKQWLSGDRVPIEPKGKQTYDYTPYTKFFVNTNELPEVFDDSDAFFRRWHLIDFPNQFEDKDPALFIQELTTPEELSGLLNICIAKLKKIKTDGFSQSMSVAESRDRWKNDADPIRRFGEEMLSVELNSTVVLSELNSKYLSWCSVNKKVAKGQITLNRKIRLQFPSTEESSISVAGKPAKVFKGIKFKDQKQERLA